MGVLLSDLSICLTMTCVVLAASGKLQNRVASSRSLQLTDALVGESEEAAALTSTHKYSKDAQGHGTMRQLWFAMVRATLHC